MSSAALAAAAAAQPPAAPQVATLTSGPALGAVHGVVYDSLTRHPLAGALVQLVRIGDPGVGRTAPVDSTGAFRLDSLAPGQYALAFAHPLLDLLQLEVAPRGVDIGPAGGDARVDLAIPDVARVRPALCGSEQAPNDSSALVAGRVRTAGGDAPVAHATVVLTWSTIGLGRTGLVPVHHRVPVTTGSGGAYVLCGVPYGEALRASAAAPGRASGPVAIEAAPRGLVWRDFVLGDSVGLDPVPNDPGSPASAAGGAAVPGNATSAGRAAGGTARLTGTVRDTAGRPLAGAHVFVWGTSVAATADAQGAFALDGLPSGTRTVEARAIGFAPRQVAVDLAGGRTSTTEVRLGRPVPTLAGVTVRASLSRRWQQIEAFLDRRKHTPLGYFVTGADVERIRPLWITDALRTVPRLHVVPRAVGGNGLEIGFGSRACSPAVFLNGMAIEKGENLDWAVNPDEVAGIEVYTDRYAAPAEYAGRPGTACGIVLVWTVR